MHIHESILFSLRLFPHIGHYRVEFPFLQNRFLLVIYFIYKSVYVNSNFPLLHNRFLLAIHFIYSSVYMSIPVSQSIPPLTLSPRNHSLFSTSVILHLFCK